MAKYSWLAEQLLSFDTDHKYFHKDKIIIIMNGYGKSGKDYLIDHCIIDHTSVSSITPIKEIAQYAISDETEVTDKTLHYRNFLHDLKDLCDKYYDTSLRYLINKACIFLRSDKKILFVFISELEKIEEFKKHMLPYVATYSLFVIVPKEIGKKRNICYDDPRFGPSTQKEIEELIQHHDYTFSNKFDTFSIAAFNTLITCIYDDSKLHRDEEQSIPLHKVHLCIIYDSLHLFHNNGDADIKEDIYFDYNRNRNTSTIYNLFHINAKFILNKEEYKYDLDNSRSEFDYEYTRNDVKNVYMIYLIIYSNHY